MPSDSGANAPQVLLVSDSQDDAARRCADQLFRAGVAVDRVASVYAAMARLAQGRVSGPVLVDIRSLDSYEMAFLNLAPRYYPRAEVLVPLLNGAADRLASHRGSLRSATIEAIIGTLRPTPAPSVTDSTLNPPAPVSSPALPIPRPLPARATEAPAATERTPPSVEPRPPQPTQPLSTDGGPQSAPAGTSLHEAVRMRMAGGDPRAVQRRTPPGATAPRGSSPTPAAPARAALSPEEIDALLKEPDDSIPGSDGSGGAP